MFLRAYTAGRQEPLIRFDLSRLKPSSRILRAEMRFYVGSRTNVNTLMVELFPLRREWDPQAVTWNQPWAIPGANGESDRAPAPEALMTLDVPGDHWGWADVTGMVQHWVDAPAENFGCVLRARPGGGVQYALRSSDHPEQKHRPSLMIYYSDPPPTPTATPTSTPTPRPADAGEAFLPLILR